MPSTPRPRLGQRQADARSTGQWLLDRLACAFFGAVFGALWGLVPAIAVGYATDGRFQTDLLLANVAVFAGLGLVLGPLVGDLIGFVIHFICGLFAGILSGASGGLVDPEPRTEGWLRGLFVMGLGSGFALWLWWRYF